MARSLTILILDKVHRKVSVFVLFPSNTTLSLEEDELDILLMINIKAKLDMYIISDNQ